MVSTITNDKCLKLVGLSTDEKPTNENIGNGSIFFELDTGKVYIFNGATTAWTELSGAIIAVNL